MKLRDLAAALALGGVGATVGAVTAVGYPAVLAVGTATVAALSCCTLFDRRELAVEVGLACYGVLGVATLATGLAPQYPREIGLAILASAGIAFLGVEVASRAGATIHAAKTGDGSCGRWRRSARVFAGAIDRWNGDRRDRLPLLGVPGIALAIHLAVVATGGAVGIQAATLVPVAVSAVAIFAYDSATAFVAPNDSGFRIPTARFSAAPAAIASRTDGVTDRLGSLGGRSVHERDRSSASSATEGGARSATPSAAVTTDRTRSGVESAAGDRSLDPCQNCGAESDDRAERFVVSAEDHQVVLCADCQEARIETMRSLEGCAGDAVRGAIADEMRCGACGESTALQAHPIVPLDAGGHRHPNNVLALCATCHRAVDDHATGSGSQGSPGTATRDHSR